MVRRRVWRRSDLKKLQIAAGPVRSDKSGRHSGLYREHCVHCHGISGDGWVRRPPSSSHIRATIAQGKFKFKSTDADMPTDDGPGMHRRATAFPGRPCPHLKWRLTQTEIEVLVSTSNT